ncbi:peptidase inhibitor 15-like [Ptychodera flava]|uniref:peptidase inhibitor 15-like n=1 Tax=Ptychodera flava TaxID=63121 RepID=UPI00396A55BB
MKAIYVIFCVQHLCIVWTGSSNEQGRHLRYSLTAHDGDKGSPSSGRQRYRRFTDYTESDIEYWINRHNQHRGEVDPPASDMKFMTWDDDLATMAQTWVDYCHWEHGDPDIQHSYEHTGQNMWVFGPSSLEERPTVSDAVDAWYDERYDYDYETNSCVPGRVCGHYTQVVWAESQALGCGIAFCPTVNNSQYVDSWMIVCNYGPSEILTKQYIGYATSGDTTCVTGLPTSPNPGSQHGDVTTSGHHTTSGTPTHEGVDVATSRSATSPSQTTQSHTTVMTPTAGQRSTLSPTVMTTIWMYTGSTECEVIIHCLNGGTFDAVYCECVCLDEYQGNACERE